MIKLICVGKIKENYLKDGINEYLKRLGKYTKFELIELEDSDIVSESKLILNKLNKKDYNIALTIDGIMLDSVNLSKKIDNILIINSNITFIIGGSNGIDDSVIELCNEKISFSKLTFPHQLFRMVFLEQLYRSFKIMNNETYHK